MISPFILDAISMKIIYTHLSATNLSNFMTLFSFRNSFLILSFTVCMTTSWRIIGSQASKLHFLETEDFGSIGDVDGR